MYLVVAYDVSEDDVRNKIAEVLKAFGLQRIQRSVFVGRLPPALVKELAEKVARVARSANAQVVIFKVDKRAVETAIRIPPAPARRGDVELY
ncbi:CRISPR-associated endonuclease Cas2 [Pyrobaculum sp.]|uniref:CRISPR-associated endonuclease Cas2 n=1 Tax=Pyrobaculum sp. TaxID=2004705 RepID=UPI003166CF1E